MINKTDQSIGLRFSAAASSYNANAAIPRKAAALIAARAEKLPTPTDVIELGSGTGILTEHLSRLWPACRYRAVDVSADMNRLAHSRLHREGLEFITSDILDYRPASLAEVVVSSAALHWISPFHSAAESAAAMLQAGGTLLIGVMLKGTLGELHASRNRVAPHKTVQQTLPEQSSVLLALEQAGFSIDNSSVHHLMNRYPNAKSFIQSIHDQGLTGGPQSHGHAALTRSELMALMDDYNRHYSSDDDHVFSTSIYFIVKARRV